MTTTDLTDLFGPVIARHTRAQLIADGFLVDVTAVAREARFLAPVAITRAVYEDCVAWDDSDNERKGTLQDADGRLWDVVWMARLAAGQRGDRVTYTIVRTPRAGRARKPVPVQLVLHIGPGDQGEPVVTIMQPGES